MAIVPIFTSPGSLKLMGLLQVIHRRPDQGTVLRPPPVQRPVFTQEDVHLLGAVAKLVGDAGRAQGLTLAGTSSAAL